MALVFNLTLLEHCLGRRCTRPDFLNGAKTLKGTYGETNDKRRGAAAVLPSLDIQATAKRTRVAASLPKKEKVDSGMAVVSFASTGSTPETFSPRQHKTYEAMLHAMGNGIKALFDKSNMKQRWDWDQFGITTSAEVVNRSDTWKAMSDQCHGASLLCQVRCTQKALASLARVSQTLTLVIGEQEPWTFVYIWRIMLIVRGISHRLTPSKHAFLISFWCFSGG